MASQRSHRHDGTSPLPLGMDWSPPPKRWEGNNTLWPHQPCGYWSYCVMVPFWVVQPEAGPSVDQVTNPIILYRVQVGMQSPDGISSSYEVVRRFSDFLKLFLALKQAFPKKEIPPAPPKHSLLRVNSSKLLLEKRKRALEDWMSTLLCDIDLSRSAPVADFLELEAAARSAFEAVDNHIMRTNLSCGANAIKSSFINRTSSDASFADCSTFPSISQSTASDYGSDYSQEPPFLEVPTDGDNDYSGINTEFNSVRELQINTIDCDPHKIGPVLDPSVENWRKLDFRMESKPEENLDRHSYHARNVSAESIKSDISSINGRESSIFEVTSSLANDSVYPLGSVEASGELDIFSRKDLQSLCEVQVVFSLDQQHKLNRFLVTMQRRLVTARNDMEVLISRLDEESSQKEYLRTKVRDLEVELDVTKHKSSEILQQSVLAERENLRQIQWEMDELRRNYLEAISKLKFEQDKRARAESEKKSAISEKEFLLKELDIKKEQLAKLQGSFENMETNSKEGIKLLVKEVKSLRSSHTQLKEALNQSIREKTEMEKAFQMEKLRWVHANSARKTLLNECRVISDRLEECSVNILAQAEDQFSVSPSSLPDALGLLMTSDNRIDMLLAEAQLLVKDDEHAPADLGGTRSRAIPEDPLTINYTDVNTTNDDMRRILIDVVTNNLRLRKHANSIIRCALKTAIKPEKEDNTKVSPGKALLGKFFQR